MSPKTALASKVPPVILPPEISNTPSSVLNLAKSPASERADTKSPIVVLLLMLILKDCPEEFSTLTKSPGLITYPVSRFLILVSNPASSTFSLVSTICSLLDD